MLLFTHKELNWKKKRFRDSFSLTNTRNFFYKKLSKLLSLEFLKFPPFWGSKFLIGFLILIARKRVVSWKLMPFQQVLQKKIREINRFWKDLSLKFISLIYSLTKPFNKKVFLHFPVKFTKINLRNICPSHIWASQVSYKFLKFSDIWASVSYKPVSYKTKCV